MLRLKFESNNNFLFLNLLLFINYIYFNKFYTFSEEICKFIFKYNTNTKNNNK